MMEEVSYMQEGILDMDDRQDFFGVDWKGAGYEQYFIAESNGGSLKIAWDVPISSEGQVHFFELEKE